MYSLANDLRNSFFQNSPDAVKGKKLIDKIFENEKNLKRLLRNHSGETITDAETWKRESVDCFIEYFSFMSLAYVSGYLQSPLPKPMTVEARKYLGNSYIQQYYAVFYPQVLPQILYLKVTGSGQFKDKVEYSKEVSQLFVKFVRLSNSIKNEEVDSFLWLLDDGEYQERSGRWIGIENLINSLRNPKRYTKILIKNDKESYERDVLIGFFKYCNFLVQYSEFLKNIKTAKLAQSAYWHYYGYWFVRFRDHLKEAIEVFFEGLESQKMSSLDANLEILKRNKKLYLGAIKSLCFSAKYSGVLERHLKTILTRERPKSIKAIKKIKLSVARLRSQAGSTKFSAFGTDKWIVKKPEEQTSVSINLMFKKYSNNLNSIAYHTLSSLLKHLNANQGAVYLVDRFSPTARPLAMVARFPSVYGRKVNRGQGALKREVLVSEAWVNQETKYFTEGEVPEGYSRITSGLGDPHSKSILIVPLKVDNRILGILQISSNTMFTQNEIQFVQRIAERLAKSVFPHVKA
jgi:hypothetical protein